MAALLLGDIPAEASEAVDTPIKVGEVSPPPPSSGVDAALVRAAAEGEIRLIDAGSLPKRRRVVVSLALRSTGAESSLDYTVNALVRDAKTGVMIAIIETNSHGEGTVTAERKKEIAQGAVRNAVRRIPSALGGNK